MRSRLLSPIAALILAACSGGADDAPAPQAPSVTVAQPLVQQVRDWDDYVGRFEAVESVEVRPRVTGYLQQVHLNDGQYVRAGEPLFTIDPRPARAAFQQARAQLARAEALLANARTELARSETLAASQAASQEEVEQRRAAVRAGVAEVAAARANVEAQQLQVNFTTVRAPISGRVSERLVDAGNSVIADQTVLARIVSVSPIHFSFEGSEALLLKYQRQDIAGTGAPVRVKLQDEASYVHPGRIDYIDPAIDPGSGTVSGRAVLPNPDGFLKPGMVGRMQLAGSDAYEAVLVPDTAIVTDAARRLVFVLDDENTVLARAVELGPLVGELRVIRSGLAADERVIIGGVQRAQPGQKVQPQEGSIEQSSADAEPEATARTPRASSAEIVGSARD
ncbi:efflux RND transporter periplasmic adaptor subunit [Aurantiacibacter poecillastricola]|uniref:efflux RND transporter periplasmic adaptor subunit n=1 Tax=Aurantiacibacter poecillastricola TaxID=3064385 RepID=UPI00273D9757|nr:efflux RND transporter periplasmic adaptor subunit [Aurantiacibacter sp. 219JJ12-13]MDP5261155.1 efflux RND transporter periplasmic adaptor subunit [Aurantiacibacter sp. 219JJ12-13]